MSTELNKLGSLDEGSAERTAWRREAADQGVSERIGQRVRDRRERLGLSLTRASELTGIPAATLSRVETNKMSPTLPILMKMMMGLRLPWVELMGEHTAVQADEISIAMPDQETPLVAGAYAYHAPHYLSRINDHIQPLILDVLPRDLEGAGGLRGHRGYELCYVLSGTLLLHFAGREPQELPPGGSALFNCEVPHAYVGKSRAKTRILIVVMQDPLMNEQVAPLMARSAG